MPSQLGSIFLLLKMMNRIKKTHESLVICPVYNEEETIEEFYRNLREHYMQDVVFVDDGSTDSSRRYLASVESPETFLITHPERLGYGAALLSGFRFSLERGYRKIITIDVDLQHNPREIPAFLNALDRERVVLGSRYISSCDHFNIPGERLAINRYISGLIKRLYAVHFTDPFCGYRGYRESILKRMVLKQKSYGLGLEIILEIIRTGVSFKEIPIKAIYNNHLRKFLDGLDDPKTRLLYYLEILSAKREFCYPLTGDGKE